MIGIHIKVSVVFFQSHQNSTLNGWIHTSSHQHVNIFRWNSTEVFCINNTDNRATAATWQIVVEIQCSSRIPAVDTSFSVLYTSDINTYINYVTRDVHSSVNCCCWTLWDARGIVLGSRASAPLVVCLKKRKMVYLHVNAKVKRRRFIMRSSDTQPSWQNKASGRREDKLCGCNGPFKKVQLLLYWKLRSIVICCVYARKICLPYVPLLIMIQKTTKNSMISNRWYYAPFDFNLKEICVLTNSFTSNIIYQFHFITPELDFNSKKMNQHPCWHFHTVFTPYPTRPEWPRPNRFERSNATSH